MCSACARGCRPILPVRRPDFCVQRVVLVESPASHATPCRLAKFLSMPFRVSLRLRPFIVPLSSGGPPARVARAPAIPATAPLTRSPAPAGRACSPDLSADAQTVNPRGLTLVPLEVAMKDGDVWIRAKDPACATRGPDEIQKFR